MEEVEVVILIAVNNSSLAPVLIYKGDRKSAEQKKLQLITDIKNYSDKIEEIVNSTIPKNADEVGITSTEDYNKYLKDINRERRERMSKLWGEVPEFYGDWHFYIY